MAIVQRITQIDVGLSFDDWVASLTGEAKTAAEALIASRNTKFDAQVAAGNVYFNKDGERVWISVEAEQAHMDDVGLEYAALWDQWKEETGGSLEVVFEEEVTAARLVKGFDEWAKDTLSAADFNNLVTDRDSINAIMAGRTRDQLTAEELSSIRGAHPNYAASLDAYNAYVASL